MHFAGNDPARQDGVPLSGSSRAFDEIVDMAVVSDAGLALVATGQDAPLGFSGPRGRGRVDVFVRMPSR